PLAPDAGCARGGALDAHHVLAGGLRRQCRSASGVPEVVWGAFMNVLAPLESLYEGEHGRTLPLPPELATLYGRLQFPSHVGRPYVIGNFVSTLDGVVSLNIPGKAGGGPISGFNPHDHLIMGLLRGVADAVIVGAGTLRAVSPHHRWTAEYINPGLSDVYQQ